MVRVRIRVSLGFRDTVRVSFRVSVRVTVTLGFRDRVRVKVRASFRLPTFIYYVWPPVSVRVSLGFRDRVSTVKVRVSFRL